MNAFETGYPYLTAFGHCYGCANATSADGHCEYCGGTWMLISERTRCNICRNLKKNKTMFVVKADNSMMCQSCYNKFIKLRGAIFNE